jgi:hypothetical protein
MAAGGNAHLLPGIARLFMSQEGSDCTIRFCKDKSEAVVNRYYSSETRSHGNTSSEDENDSFPDEIIVAHTFVLRLASQMFESKISRWTVPDSGGIDEIVVSLSSASEIPAAIEAIRFAYTGDVRVTEDNSVRQLLDVRRLAEYMQIKGCMEKCDGLLADKLSTGDTATLAENILQFYQFVHMWPTQFEREASFDGDLFPISQNALVAYFKDASSTLNTGDVFDNLLRLPAIGLQHLLSSDNFATDCEDTVLLLLAMWMRENYHKTDESTRKDLCAQLRFRGMTRNYRLNMLMHLAAEHDAHPDEPGGWFPMGLEDFTCMYNFYMCTNIEQKRALLEHWSNHDAWSDQNIWFRESLSKPARNKRYTTMQWHVDWETYYQNALKSESTTLNFGNRHNIFVAYGYTWSFSLDPITAPTSVGITIYLKINIQIPDVFPRKSMSDMFARASVRITFNKKLHGNAFVQFQGNYEVWRKTVAGIPSEQTLGIKYEERLDKSAWSDYLMNSNRLSGEVNVSRYVVTVGK